MGTKEEKPEPTHNMVEVELVRKDGDPKMCPVMTAPLLISASPPRIQGGAINLLVRAAPVACAGSPCALWDSSGPGRYAGQCSLKGTALLKHMPIPGCMCGSLDAAIRAACPVHKV